MYGMRHKKAGKVRDMIIKTLISDKKLVVVLCDKNILGKKFTSGNKVLDLSSNFYQGEERDAEYIKKALQRSYIINAVGKKSTDFLMDNSYAVSDDVRKIGKIPYLNILVGNELS